VGLIGNLNAYRQGKRFIKKDLNRQFTEENVNRINNSPTSELDEEDIELKELLATIHAEIKTYQPSKIVFLDFHTTTAFGGIFTIPQETPESLAIAVELHAPVVKGLLTNLKGTTLHYLTEENFGKSTVAVTFESGQHNEPLSINRAIAALTNCMRTIGCVEAAHIENRHDKILIEFSNGLPKIAELITIHSIQPNDDFEMVPNYKNFQTVKKGETLARDRHGEIFN